MAGTKAAADNRVIDAPSGHNWITPVVIGYEVYKRTKATLGEETALRDVAALDRTRIVPVDREIALEAADYSLPKGLHFSDALIHAAARRYGAELDTSDPSLRDLAHVTFI